MQQQENGELTTIGTNRSRRSTGRRSRLPRLLPSAAIVAALVLIAAGTASAPAPAAAAESEAPTLSSTPTLDDAALDPRDGGASTLSSSELRTAVELSLNTANRTEAASDVLVEVHYDATHTSLTEAREVVVAAGGTVAGEIDGWLVEAWIPLDQLEALEAQPGIRYLTVPRVSEPQGPASDGSESAGPAQAGVATGSHVVESNADEWHANGWDAANRDGPHRRTKMPPASLWNLNHVGFAAN